MLAFLCDAYDEEELEGGDMRTVLHLHPALAPYQGRRAAPARRISWAARRSEIYSDLAKYFMVEYDETGSIGKRYRRQDEIGTPYCITVDFDTETDGSVTVRDRDTMQQERVKVEDLKAFIESKLRF